MAAKATGRRTSARPALPAANGHANGHGGPKVIRLTTPDAAGQAPGIPLFSIDDTEYTMPAVPSANVALKYLDLARTQGQEAAVSYMLEAMLGTDGYQALINYDALTTADLTAVIEVAAEHLTGALEVPKGP